MGKLREMLEADADRYRKERTERNQTLGSWISLLENLYSQLETWLKASDPEGLLEITRYTSIVNDPTIGEYQAPCIKLTLGRNSTYIVPKSRRVAFAFSPTQTDKPVQAQGLVEIRHIAWPSYDLLKLPGGWHIRQHPTLLDIHYPVNELTADRFEEAIAGLLR